MSQQDTYTIKISPEVILDDIFTVNYSGGTATVYSSMTMILSGGTGGTSLLTGLTIPILFTQKLDDVGYYSEFDGNLLQSDIVTNFIYSATSANPYTYLVTNTSDVDFKKYLEQTTFLINWGDFNPTQPFNTYLPNYLTHNYAPLPATYTISISGITPWGINIVQKTIDVPFTGMTIPNPNGTAYFVPNGGEWSATPTSYDFIFSGDAVNQISAQTSNNYTSIPFAVTGITKSRVNDLAQYGVNKFLPGLVVTGTSGIVGVYYGLDQNGIVTYTIDNVVFYDYPNGTTIYNILSSGITSDMITQVPIVKDEALIGVVMEPEVQSNIFIERGKNTALERIERLGEIDNMGDLEKYGYSFFNVKTYN
jgi:hypothetical protein